MDTEYNSEEWANAETAAKEVTESLWNSIDDEEDSEPAISDLDAKDRFRFGITDDQ